MMMAAALPGGGQYPGQPFHGSAVAVTAGSAHLHNFKSQVVGTLEEVRSIQERAARDIRERAAKEQELREELQGTRDKVDRLKTMLEGTARDLRSEVQDLRNEHQELESELRALVDMAQQGYQTESENRSNAAADLQRQAAGCTENQAADRKKREDMVARVRQEVTASVQAQIEQEATALAQSTEFIREVNVALQSEGTERARRDQGIEQAVQVTRTMVTEVSDKLQEAQAALDREVASRQKDNECRKVESEEMWENIRLQQRKVEAQQLGQLSTGASTPRAVDGVASARPVVMGASQSAASRGDPLQRSSGYAVAASDSEVRQVQTQGQASPQAVAQSQSTQFQSQGSIRAHVLAQPQAQSHGHAQQQLGPLTASQQTHVVSKSPERRRPGAQQGMVILPQSLLSLNRQVPVQWMGPNASGSNSGSSTISHRVPQPFSPRQVQSPPVSGPMGSQVLRK